MWLLSLKLILLWRFEWMRQLRYFLSAHANCFFSICISSIFVFLCQCPLKNNNNKNVWKFKQNNSDIVNNKKKIFRWIWLQETSWKRIHLNKFIFKCKRIYFISEIYALIVTHNKNNLFEQQQQHKKGVIYKW